MAKPGSIETFINFVINKAHSFYLMLRLQRQYIWKNINVEHVMCNGLLFFSFYIYHKKA